MLDPNFPPPSVSINVSSMSGSQLPEMKKPYQCKFIGTKKH